MRSTLLAVLALISLMTFKIVSAAADARVIVTIKPIHSLVAGIMAGEPAPDLLLEGGASPHTYALKPSDVRRLGEARVIVRVSENLEAFLDKPLKVIGGNSRIVTIDRLPGMTLLPLRTTDDDDGHGHADHNHKAGVHGATGIDPHIWLDPSNARIAVAALAEALAAASPADAERYRRNAEAIETRLADLDRRLIDTLKPVQSRRFLVFHDAYQYLEHRYGLADAGAVAINPDVPTSARHLARLRARLAEAKVACVFAEPQFPPRAIAAIVEGTSVRQATLDPLGAAIPAGPDQYFSMMQGLAQDLVKCLGAGS
ncbi:MAG: zinc ABC transporter substrate-binding protein [Proteobacteria bacterium]|nr:zinc ABC transporter substrate-binding protein [Pseudomonadota bacterium]